ncbi:MAG: CtkA family protein [Holdemanella sp.]|uniref:CtkA family protein n=1 Tax=Holdemanella porci TaxID=2652276 RepID=UPI002A1A1536|nr:CtkA family protein [Holdemanella sp.]
MKIYDFNNCKENGLRYGGHAGNKLGIIIDNENWFLKFPKSTKDLTRKVEISYTTSPLSEYIGSHIYESIGIPVHETKLGIKNGKVVVACKDFRKDTRDFRLDDYNSIKNDYVDGMEEKLESVSSSSNDHNVSLEEVEVLLNNHPLFLKNPELKERFWDMFVVDALIGNNDRNNGNWGVLVNNITNETTVCPVFDNGAAFNTKSSDEQIQKIMNDNNRFESSVYKSRMCIFVENDKQLNPFKYIESLKNKDCDEALMRIVPKINVEKIKKMIHEIPNEVDGIQVISDIRKEFYCKCVEYRYEKSLYPTYLKIKEMILDKSCSKVIKEEQKNNNKDSLNIDLKYLKKREKANQKEKSQINKDVHE